MASKKGDKVKIIRGAFKGQEGIVTETSSFGNGVKVHVTTGMEKRVIDTVQEHIEKITSIW